MGVGHHDLWGPSSLNFSILPELLSLFRHPERSTSTNQVWAKITVGKNKDVGGTQFRLKGKSKKVQFEYWWTIQKTEIDTCRKSQQTNQCRLPITAWHMETFPLRKHQSFCLTGVWGGTDWRSEGRRKFEWADELQDFEEKRKWSLLTAAVFRRSWHKAVGW